MKRVEVIVHNRIFVEVGTWIPALDCYQITSEYSFENTPENMAIAEDIANTLCKGYGLDEYKIMINRKVKK